MCGIIGYTGPRQADSILLAGLRRLEYRGYDSAGVAILGPAGMAVRRRAGRVGVLEAAIQAEPAAGTAGIGHTRWATHGPPSDVNAHPHVGGDNAVAVVHNGVIENHRTLRLELEADGFTFRSQTDTEVIAHLIARELGDGDDLRGALLRALPRLEGTYGLAAVSPRRPGEILGARLGSPLVVGLGEGEHLLASDPAAVAPHTTRVAHLGDGEVVRITPSGIEIEHRDLGPVAPRVDRIDWAPDAVELAGFAHYMRKEIADQPETVRDACRGRLRRAEATAHFGGLNLSPARLRRARRVVLIGCGTSWHAALVGEYLIERLANLPVEVEYAGEFRYRNAPIDDRTLVFVLSQSGETADTLGALRESKRRGHPTLAICNVVGSTIAREAHGGIYVHAGPEIGVASTKAFSAQVAVLTMLALHLGRLRHLAYPDGQAVVDALSSVPDLLGQILATEPAIEAAAVRITSARAVLFLGRDLMFPVALEGALKLEEISYIPALGYPTAEMKHGPIALLDPATPCVFIAPRGALHAKTLSNVEEAKARGAPIIAIGTEGDEDLLPLVDAFLPIPDAPEVIHPLLAVVPLQLLAYHVARLKGCDIDKPRNLAKSVTVE